MGVEEEDEEIDQGVFQKIMKIAFKDLISFLDERAVKNFNLGTKVKKNRLPSFLLPD